MPISDENLLKTLCELQIDYTPGEQQDVYKITPAERIYYEFLIKETEAELL